MNFDHIAALVIGACALYAVAKGLFLLILPRANARYLESLTSLEGCHWPNCSCPTPRQCSDAHEIRELIDGP